MASATTMLLSSLIYFKDGYVAANEYNEGLRQVKWPLDYFMKCHQQTDRFYAQVRVFSSSDFKEYCKS